jgi:hypothetical protein
MEWQTSDTFSETLRQKNINRSRKCQGHVTSPPYSTIDWLDGEKVFI